MAGAGKASLSASSEPRHIHHAGPGVVGYARCHEEICHEPDRWIPPRQCPSGRRLERGGSTVAGAAHRHALHQRSELGGPRTFLPPHCCWVEAGWPSKQWCGWYAAPAPASSRGSLSSLPSSSSGHSWLLASSDAGLATRRPCLDSRASALATATADRSRAGRMARRRRGLGKGYACALRTRMTTSTWLTFMPWGASGREANSTDEAGMSIIRCSSST